MMGESKREVNIIGAGLSGLSCALTLAREGASVNLISAQPSERAQSVLAEGGINAALDTMGEGDRTEYHLEETLKAGCYLESEEVIRGLTENAPEIVREMAALGVPFNTEDGDIALRHFGGQINKRTAFAKSSTGKMLMTALIDEVRKYEAEGLVMRYPHHELADLNIESGRLVSCIIKDTYTGEHIGLSGTLVLCTGGLNGLFEGMTTGTTANNGDAAGIAFMRGAEFANLEFIQYHPTTARISDKVMLISEAARGEGGRLYIMRGGKPWYFMEEKYPKLGNLMPRDVVSREMTMVSSQKDCEGSVYLDLTGLSASIWADKLPDLRQEIEEYLGIDPADTPVPVRPGIHYFMGGIRVDRNHRTNIEGLYAAGEAACRYHGANRLGGNSTMGAIYGGRVAAKSILEEEGSAESFESERETVPKVLNADETYDPVLRTELTEILSGGLGILRDAGRMEDALERVRRLRDRSEVSYRDEGRIRLGEAMIMSALSRRESRGAHTRTDFPETDDKYRKFSVAVYDGENIKIGFEDAEPETAGTGEGGELS